jgi:hypothetical protein
MAYTILQEPTSPNVSNTNLVYTVSSSNANLYQYNYLADIYEEGSGTKSARFKFSANKTESGNIDLARPLGDYLSFDYNWKINNSSSLDNSVETFTVKFGEEYASSDSSSVVTYADQASMSIQLFKGQVYPSENTNGFNWTSQPILTNSPTTQSFSANDYLTATVYDTNVTVKYYQTGSLTATKNYVPTSDFSAIPISPLNIGLYTESDVITLDVTGSSIRYEVDNDCRIEKQRFAFTNKFGFWDYYTNNTALRKRTNIDRNTYGRDFVDYSQKLPTYNISNRGTVQYYTEYTDEFQYTTDQVTAEESNWLREMFESNEVYLQSGSNFIPVNILNSTETIVNTTARYKNYQYTVDYRFANNREPR